MKLEIKNRLKRGWAVLARAVPRRDRESLVIRRKGKRVKIRNGSTRADITYTSSDRAKEVVSALIGSTEEAIGKCPIE